MKKLRKIKVQDRTLDILCALAENGIGGKTAEEIGTRVIEDFAMKINRGLLEASQRNGTKMPETQKELAQRFKENVKAAVSPIIKPKSKIIIPGR